MELLCLRNAMLTFPLTETFRENWTWPLIFLPYLSSL